MGISELERQMRQNGAARIRILLDDIQDDERVDQHGPTKKVPRLQKIFNHQRKRPRSYRKKCRVSRGCGKTRPTRVTGTKTQVHSPYSVISKLEEESPNEDQR